MAKHLLFGLFLACVVSVHAKSINSEIFRVVRDGWGGVVTRARIVVVSRDTGFTKEDQCDEQDRFRFPLLQPGFYSVTSEHAGIGASKLYSPMVVNAARVGSLALKQVISVGSKYARQYRTQHAACGRIGNYDFSVPKRLHGTEQQNVQLRDDFFNLTNTRDFGIPKLPEGARTEAAAASRGLRYQF